MSKAAPCAVCGGDHKCSRGDSGLIICGRRDGPVPGFRHLGAAKGDPQFHLFRRDEGADAAPAPARKPKPTPPRDWGVDAARYAKGFTAEARQELASRLGLPPAAFDALPLLGVSGGRAAGRVFAFPECDATGRVVGITERIPEPDGTEAKKMRSGGGRGLTVPNGWRDRPGPVLLVEGASDTLALTVAGLGAVGRPSNTGGVEHLAALLADLPVDRKVVVVGENDRKEDGSWPGREGSERVASTLRSRLGRGVMVAMPPDGAKDVRAWLVDRAGENPNWAALGRELLGLLTASAQVPAGGRRPEVVVTTAEHAVNDAAAAALPAAERVYQRGGLLVHVLALDAPTAGPAAVRQPAGAVVVRELSQPLLREEFTRVADWVRVVETKEGPVTVPTHPPGWCVQAVHARGHWPGVRNLEAVVTHPILLADGSLLVADGYHRPTGVLVRLPPGLRLAVADAPTRADVAAAVKLLFDAVCDFPFERPEHRGAWLAGLLTPLAWFAFDGPSPFYLIDGNVRGVGKGLLADAIAIPVLGRRFSAMSYTADRDELRKRITSVAAEGERMVLLDNLAGPVGNDQLDAALTADRWKDRLLGGNRVFDGPLNVVWYGTGNNCELRADTSRRTCHVRLESPAERPEERAGFRHPHLRQHLRRHRDALLSAALTILRGWVTAGRPRHGLPPWGSYESWSEVVREAVVWAGEPDPGLTRVALQTAADRNALAMTVLLNGLRRIDPDRQGLTASGIVEAAKTHPDLRAAVEDLAGRLDTRPLGYALRSFARRNFDGLFLDNAATTGQGVRWAAYPITEFRSRPTSPPSPPSPPTPPGGDGGDGDDAPGRAPQSGRLFETDGGRLPD
ncbi:MAG: hypothetical protein C0501_04655 [Isosphaera sp.]|nr:hypothetical protein [Isosphaera sp.]